MQRKLLLVDDEVGILRALRRLFRKAGYQISIAESAEEALELLAVDEFPVILSDFRMPGADGGTLLQRAVELDPPCVGLILSGFAELKQVLGAFNSGAVHRFVSKPWSDDDLLEQVENAFHIAEQKRSDIDMDRRGLLNSLQRDYQRLYPVNLVDELDSVAGQVKALYAVEFSSPRVVLAQEQLDTKSALALLTDRLVRSVLKGTVFCHWNGYTLMLLGDSQQSALIEEQLQNQSSLRWSVSHPTELAGADRVRQLLFNLAHTDADKAEFASSGWSTLRDTELSETISRAVKERSFSAVFQPICADTGELTALEALVRCPAVTDSDVSLSELIRQIDLLGYTDLFTDLQLAAALSEFQSLDLPAEIKLVLNISLRQCSSPHLQSLLVQHVSESGVELERIAVDVGEAALRSKIPCCMANLEWLRAEGVELTLDDQGAAHAYFNTDDVLAVDAVKLDRAFLHELDAHANRQEMLVNLCDRIEERGKRLSFEGVENQQQLAFVREHYRFSYQGYGLARPMCGAEIRTWLAQREPR